LSNPLYSHSSAAPVAQTRGTSATIRTEFDAIASAFDAVSNSVMGIGVESGSGNAFVLTLTPAPTVAPTKGTFAFLATQGNTGAATLKLGALAAIPLLSNDGTPLTSGYIAAGELVTCYTNGTNAYLLGVTKSYVDAKAFSSALPNQAGNNGKFIKTDGTTAYWSDFSIGAGTVASPSVSLSDAATGLYRPAFNQFALSINGVISELNQASGKTVYGNMVFGTGVTFPANMTVAQLLALTGAPKADGTGATGTGWGISITGSAASAVTSATCGVASNLSGTSQWSTPYQSASAVTSYVAAGVAGQILTSAGNAAPVWSYPKVNINSQSAAYTFALTDGGGMVYHPPADTTARTWTIPSNASVAFDVGTVITIDNDYGAGALTISITTDTLVLVGAAGSTGSRTVASGTQAAIVKVSSTRWRISGAT
jgi:hypothetical protein